MGVLGFVTGRPARNFFFLLGLLVAWPLPATAWAKVVHYDLTATRGEINLSGKETVDWAILINGGIPAPTLEFTEGDEAEITVKNAMDEEMSIHWHGILLPPDQDGVPYVNSPPIMPGTTYTFRFKIRQHGTYWYHSHTMVQEQKGIYGALVIHPKERRIQYDRDAVVVLSDWSDENAEEIIRNLRKDGDYYLYKKDSVRSWAGAIRAGELGTYLGNEWTRMGGMDLSDVGYDAFLINGKLTSQLVTGRPGEKVRIRIINAAASSYFYIGLGQSPFQVIAADGVDVEPVLTKEILIGMAETYDILFEIPEGKRVELRATAQDVTGYASTWLGEGQAVPVPNKAKPNLYAAMDHAAMDHAAMDHAAMDHAAMDHAAMDHAAMGHEEAGAAAPVDHSKMDHSKMDHSKMDHGNASGPEVDLLTVDKLKSPVDTTPPAKAPRYDLKLVLGGDMERYVWHINGKAISEDRTISVKEGDVVRFTFVNDTMMHHPMHLHGHFFRVLNEMGAFSPLKHTVDVPPHGTRTIEFLANEPGEWMLHCHNLYHMKSGMARVVKYTSFTPKPEIAQLQRKDPHLHDHMYFNGMVEVATNHAQAEVHVSQTWNVLEAHIETRKHDDPNKAEGELLYRRWMSNYLNFVAGGVRFPGYKEAPNRAVAGVGYLLPMLVESTFYLDHKRKVRLDLSKQFQWTKWILTNVDVSFRQGAKTEIETTLMYAPNWHWAAGLMATEESFGVGIQSRM